MRILVWSDGGAHTGYATVTENLGRRWHAQGADVHVLAINYRGDPWPGPLHLYPATKHRASDIFGLGRLPELLTSLKPEILFILTDLNTVAEGLRALGGRFPVPTVLYAPIDGVRLPQPWWSGPRAAHVVVAMAEHGQRVMKREAGLDVEVLTHGVEHDLLYPVTPERALVVEHAGERHRLASKQEAKALLGVAGRFVILALNRNTVRKNLYDTFRVFDRFRHAHPDAFLYVHATRKEQGGDLALLAERHGLTPEHAWVHHAGDTFLGSDKSILAWLYNAADIKLSTSMSEGFGLTDAEALACGTPVVAQDFAATTDVVGPGGILVPVQRHFTTASIVDVGLPDLDAMHEALERLYADPHLRQTLSERAVEHARRYDWDQTAGAFFRHFHRLAAMP